jgi:hypothetical protein
MMAMTMALVRRATGYKDDGNNDGGGATGDNEVDGDGVTGDDDGDGAMGDDNDGRQRWIWRRQRQRRDGQRRNGI